MGNRDIGMGQEYRHTRKHPRFAVEGKIKGRITGLHDASLVNISLGGVLIEHLQVVRPGTVSLLDISFQGKRVSVTCRVVRSLVDRVAREPDGQRALVYHTGLEFIDASEEIRQVISDYIQSVTVNATRAGVTMRSP